MSTPLPNQPLHIQLDDPKGGTGTYDPTMFPPPTRTFRVQQAVAEFHEAFHLPARNMPDLGVVSDEQRTLRQNLMDEEVREYQQAETDNNLTKIADGLADIVYVAYGTSLAYGINLNAVLAEVHQSNMSKLDGDGRPLHDADGKVRKSARYVEPNIPRALHHPTTAPATADHPNVTEGSIVEDPEGILWKVDQVVGTTIHMHHPTLQDDHGLVPTEEIDLTDVSDDGRWTVVGHTTTRQ